MTKAVALLSGGLDSTLAIKLILEQGIGVHALNFTSAFCTCNGGREKQDGGCRSEAKRVAEEFGITIKVLTKGLDYMDIVRNPRHGYGKGINPCVDCRIYMFKLAKKYMEDINASFIITGEVLGQRPMSQRRDTFMTIEKESGLAGLILRPLCAKHLSPTIPEKTGLVDREKLLDMAGRTRRPQMALAERLRIEDYPCPSGGCLLTDTIFSKKVRDLLIHKKEVTVKDLHALKIGRHFRYNGVKLIVSRNEKENTALKNLVQGGDVFLEPLDFKGPSALICGGSNNGEAEMAGSLILRYSSLKTQNTPHTQNTPNTNDGARITAITDGEERLITVSNPADEETIESIRVC